MARQRKLSEQQRKKKLLQINARTTKRRKAQYASDGDYREFAKSSSRASYRNRHGMELRNLRNARDFLSQLPALGTERLLRGLETGKPVLTFSVREMATALGGYHPNVLRQWCREGKFPRPELQAFVRGKELVYSLSQAKALMEIMGEHQDAKAYLSSEDTQTIDALHKAMREN